MKLKLTNIFGQLMKHLDNLRMDAPLKEMQHNFGKSGVQQYINFTTSPQLHGLFEGNKDYLPGYFAGQPYATAFGNYFINSALHPNKKDENFKKLVQDINQGCTKILEGNPDKPTLDRIHIVNKATWESHYDYYPTQNYMEKTISPFLRNLGIEFDIDSKNRVQIDDGGNEHFFNHIL